MIGLYIAIGIGTLVLLFLAVIIIRTLRFVPLDPKREAPEPVSYDGDKAVSDLSEMIRCKPFRIPIPLLTMRGSLKNSSRFCLAYFLLYIRDASLKT